MDERCFRPLLCTVKAELGRGQPGLMRWIWDETLPQSSIDRSTLHSAAHRATKWASGRPIYIIKMTKMENDQWSLSKYPICKLGDLEKCFCCLMHFFIGTFFCWDHDRPNKYHYLVHSVRLNNPVAIAIVQKNTNVVIIIVPPSLLAAVCTFLVIEILLVYIKNKFVFQSLQYLQI